jgi:cell division protein FtsA
MSKNSALIASLDIGTYKTSVVVAEATLQGMEVVGIGTALSQGMRKGLVVNSESTIQAIRKAVEEAELNGSCEIHKVSVGVTGGHVAGIPSHGVAIVQDREVSGEEVARALDVARAVALPPDCEILHLLPQEFLVDGYDRGQNPVGAAGVRLEANVHIVAVATSAMQMLIQCCERAGLHVSRVHFAALAAAEAVLTPEEKELGIALLDIGSGTTNIAVFHHGVVHHTGVVRVGGHNISNDLALGLRAPLAEAEKVKQRHGCALVDLLTPGEMIEIARAGGRDPSLLPRRRLSEIIELRAEEIFMLVKEQIEAAGVTNKLGCGVVITGGSAIMHGMPELAERVFRLPVRRGAPRDIGGLVDAVNSPMYAASVGLALYEMQSTHTNGGAHMRNGHQWRRVRERAVGWFRNLF